MFSRMATGVIENVLAGVVGCRSGRRVEDLAERRISNDDIHVVVANTSLSLVSSIVP
jgi:hypothetical protein